MSGKLEKLKKVRQRLQETYDRTHHFNKDKVFDEILFIFFSWRTPIIKAESIYQGLKSKFPDWNKLFDLSESEWFKILESSGKARDKSRTIVRLLETLQSDFGTIEHVENLSKKPDAEIHKYLTFLPGIKDKSAYCVMLYAMKKPVFLLMLIAYGLARGLGLLKEPIKENKIE